MAGVIGGYGVQKLMARNAENAGAGSIIVFPHALKHLQLI
jgi:hypothetical protein